jgi:hypothetical protein
LTKIRVKLPQQVIQAAFGQFANVKTLSTHAEAEATISPVGTSGVLPFPVNAATGSGNVCLFTPPNGKPAAPCDGSTSGNFGYLASPTVGNSQMGTNQPAFQDCNGKHKIPLTNRCSRQRSRARRQQRMRGPTTEPSVH